MMTGRVRKLRAAGGAAASALLLSLLCAAPAAAADSMVVQPDGKILVIGSIWPEAGAFARLNADGTVDRSFGRGGFVIDRRLPEFGALAQGSDGRDVGAAIRSAGLGRYLPDGAPDPAFAGGGVGGSGDPSRPSSPSLWSDPAAMTLAADGSITVAETQHPPDTEEAWIKRYDADGGFVENVGRLSQFGPARSFRVSDLLEASDGSLVGVGSSYEPPSGESAFLARFRPGAGAEYDSGFGGGAGVVLFGLPTEQHASTWFRALAWEGEKLLAAGTAEKNFLLARFSADGTLDRSFGDEGHVVLPIAGPSANQEWARNGATAVAPLGGGKVLMGGETSEWGKPPTGKFQLGCIECPQPLLAVVGADGKLDPSFGSGGYLRLSGPNGELLESGVEQVVPLSDGKILVKGKIPIPASPGMKAPFLARLNPDGSYDPTFGEDGLTVVRFPCTDQSPGERVRAGCVASLQAKVGLGGLRQRRPVLSVRAWPSLGWEALGGVTLTLPKYLHLTRGFRSKLNVRGAGKDAEVRVVPPHDQKSYTSLTFSHLAPARQLRVRFEPGALHLRPRIPRRGLTFKLRAQFEVARWGAWGGHDEIARRAG